MQLAVDTAGEARARASIYSFLAAVFTSHPTLDSARVVGELAATLGIPHSGAPSLRELDQEYMALFVVPSPRYVAPYESVFRDQWLLPSTLRPGSNPGEAGIAIKGLVMGESTLAVRQSYLAAGLLPEEGLPDHIGNELRFLAYLWSREAEAPPREARSLADLRVRFCQEHILKWIGELRDRVVENDRLGHYRAALQIVEDVLQDEVEA